MKKTIKRIQFFNDLRASVRDEYGKLNMLDDKSAAAFDAKKIRDDWEVVGNDLICLLKKQKNKKNKMKNKIKCLHF
ncbi:MAG: hypothetical protein V8R81_01325 [Clostridia bacterium]